MKKGKAAGPSGLVFGKIAGEAAVDNITDPVN